jgi:hypothetical protein
MNDPLVETEAYQDDEIATTPLCKRRLSTDGVL